MTKAIAICSGGMDSVTLAYFLKKQGADLHILSVDYGQRHKKELEFAFKAALDLGVEWQSVDLTTLQPLLRGSALTDPEVEVPHGHYEAESMRQTVVPNRNAILLSIATGWAVALEADQVATAVHAGDHAIYPDCRVEFISALTRTLKIANEGFISPEFYISAPFIEMTKANIATLGSKLRVPWEKTWSCYQGGDRHCGKCSTCIERREAFQLGGVKDPTEYEVSLEESMQIGGLA